MLRQRRLSETLNLLLHYLFLVNILVFFIYLSCSYFQVSEVFVIFVFNFVATVSWVIIIGSIIQILFVIVFKIFDNYFTLKLLVSSILNLIFSLAIYIIVSLIEISITNGLTFSF